MKNAPPLVSIVIPTYNHSAYLRQAIDSVLSQDYQNLELIVLDDGSTDDTQGILKSYVNIFFWESHMNMGQSATLNKGWHMAHGEILSYLSADDLLLPHAVSRSVECLLNSPDAVLSYCDFELIDPESRIIRRVIAPEYNYLEMVTKIVCAPSAGAFFWRSVFLKTGGWDPNIRRFPDYDCWLRLGLHGRFVHIHESLAAFRCHEGSETFSETSVDRAKEAITIITNFYSLPDLPIDVLLAKNQAIGNAHLLVAQLHLRSGRYIGAFREIATAVHLWPRGLFSIRFLRMLVNGLLNRYIHKTLWKIRENWPHRIRINQ